MKFSIITPTYNRPEELARNILSVLNQNKAQSLNSFSIEHIIINDSSNYDYSKSENTLIKKHAHTDETIPSSFYQIKYYKNLENKGVNHARNTAIHMATGDYVILLDDDDWLAPDALLDIHHALKEVGQVDWLVTNRAHENGKSITHNNTNKNRLSYILDYVMSKRFNGDSTHIIKSELAKRAHFAKHTKQGEELYFFLQLPDKFIYRNLNSTITHGYMSGGLTDTLKSKYKNNTWDLWKEKLNFKFFTYMVYRTMLVLKRMYF